MELQSLQPLAQQLFADVRALTFDGVGVTRASYGEGENACAAYLDTFARQEGLEVVTDRAGNFIYFDPADTRTTPAIWSGSHLDSVPQGGNYDGLAGVVAGLLVLIAAKRAGTTLPAPLKVIGFRGEESAWFGKAYMGSGALWGKLSCADLELQRRGDAISLREAFKACGADVDAIGRQERLFNPADVLAYVELHIEQGPVMVAREIPVGVVSGIRGNVRHNKIECFGEAQHSGVVPRWLRKDAVFAVSDLIVRVDNHWRALLERGTDLVVTCGVVQTNPAEHSISRVPGYAHFSFEARSKSSDTLEAFYQLVQAEMNSIERERGVQFKADRRLLSEPAVTDPHLCDLMAKACRDRGIAHERIPSGAGHDAALFANGGIPSAMVFVRNQNGSHNPYEAMELSDFMLGTQVMADTIAAITPRAASH
ncbi:MAG: hydantoinase/carbamoylase family amidase [Comamonas sp.]